MGFRNLQAFNLAMLDKQGWRILTNPNSLMARVFKAKYFPHDDVLNSKKGKNPSYAWRSIHNSLEIIRRGTRWRVGNGRRIQIWDDKWLPTPTTHKVISPQSDFGDFPMVSSLIDHDSKWWKVDVVRSIFLPFEADSILKIPLSYNLPEDCLVWVGNKKGSFTVKSAYYIASSILDSNEDGESSSSNEMTGLWKRIWHQKIPPKLKIFAWRLCVNGLPTMFNLSHRGVHCSCFCPLCDKAIETTAHALLHCDHAKLTWAHWHNGFAVLSAGTQEPVDIALDIIKNDSSSALELFIAVAWSIWWNRNQALHEGSGAPPSQIWDMAIRILGEYKEACSFSNLPLVSSLINWRPPPAGFTKINVDGAASDDGRPSSTGVIIRDSQGSSIAASCRVLSSPFPADISEALALQDGVMLALELGLSKVIFESDALSIIQAINEGNVGGEIGHIMQNIKDLASSFSWCTFQHQKREGNRAAHELARAARMTGISQVWKGVSPSFVEHIICEECGM
nr:uncharacterized protein LOC112026546 [Quercus suber]